MKRILWLLVPLLLAGMMPATAGKIRLRLPDTTAVRGATVSVPVYADSTLTGAGVTAYQLRIQYTPTALQPTGIDTVGTLSGGQGTFSTSSAGGAVTIAFAGTTPLSGKGPLIRIQFTTLTSGYASMTFQDTLTNFFNQNNGQPGVILQNASFNVQSPPKIYFSPWNGDLVIGDSLQFTASGGTAPYVWSTTNPAVGTISSTGYLKAIAPGLVRVIAQDAKGVIDTLDDVVEVRAVRLSITAVSGYPKTEIKLPVVTTSMTGLGIMAGTVAVAFDANLLQPTGIDTVGTLLGGYGQIVVDTLIPGKLTIAFAGTSPLSGAGTLVKLRARIKPNAQYSTTVSFSTALFNETMPAQIGNATVSFISVSSMAVSPNTATVLAPDSLQFSVSGGVAPYRWTTTDTTVARMTVTGLLVSKKCGVVRVVAIDSLDNRDSTDAITVDGAKVLIADQSAPRGVTVEVPVQLSRLVLTNGTPVTAVQATFKYDTTKATFRGINAPGTLVAGWAIAIDSVGDRVGFAGATTAGFTTAGVLAKLVFQTSGTVTFGASTFIDVETVVLNEGMPTAARQGGTLKIVAPPAAPAPFNPANGATGVSLSPTVYWNPVYGADRYRLQISTDSLFATTIVDDSLSATWSQRTVAGPLLIKTKYFWRVNASNGAGTSAWSTLMRFTTVAQTPDAVVLVLPVDSATVMADSVRLVWRPSKPQVTSYELDWSTSSSFSSPTTTTGITDTFKVVKGLAQGSYWWRVRARNAAGAGSNSTGRLVKIDLSTLTPPPVPSLVGPPNGQANLILSPTLGWSSSPGATVYHLQVSVDSTFATTLVNDSTLVPTLKSIGPLAPTTKHFWRVRARNAVGASAFTATWSFTTGNGLPAIADAVSPADSANVSVDSVKFIWRPALQSQTYELDLSTNPAFSSPTTTTGIVDTFAVVKGFVPGTYWWRVRARNAVGPSAYSIPRMFRIVTTGGILDRTVPDGFVLFQNHPNPFNPSTTIRYRIAERAIVRLTVFDAVGREVAQLFNGERSAGEFTAVWDATRVPSGAYYCRMEVAGLASSNVNYAETRRMVLLK